FKIRRKALSIFWPQYFDKNRPIRLGRRVSKETATDKPLVEDVLTAAKNLKYSAEIDNLSKYPRSPYDAKGLVLIDTMGQKKTFVLKKLAPEVKQAKENRMQSAKLDKVKKKRKKHKDKSELLRSKIQQRKKK
ncbi:MAG: signal recognition particle subunit SRP19/SEC65 family protein, partial [Promethearchaeota archaeon]